ncbi:hypothetical protein H634G_01273 [Metarhizium anisopliae BRIP 53293]|uniref:Myb/SANT-like domain-containing protein n=1 Tax=Metarhizium anisopliae BRIP 53293 TaxID=1291518 RepID=A0A0D9PA86_METAN|nr:hypothetical protein H634G_01273 [Metarhizium anisopliae BRIP 53293]KJK94581.1 hypothetical protein H633G_01515 [Metarhizium anisopliae BRIP 53284]
MSEDDVDMLGPDGQGSSKVDRDRRAPRFSWTPAYETTFFRSLCESVQLGLRENSSFKAEAWDRAALALQDSHGAYPAKSHLINKSDNARKRFRLWRGLREDPEFMYNPVSKTVTATEEAWRAHIEREPLSRALRGRPFDHEEYMEILYPDVIGSGGAPKRIMKPRRRTDGQPGDESDMPGTGVLNLQPESASGQNTLESPGPARSSLSQTPIGSATASGTQLKPSSTTIPPRTTPTQPSALTPPDESANHAKKRVMPAPQTEGAFGATPPPSAAKSGNATADAPSPEKKRRTSIHGDAVPVVTSTSSNCLHHASSSDSPTAVQLPPPVTLATPQTTAADSQPNGLSTCLSSSRWCELALEQFFKDFAGEDMDLQIRVAETVLVNESRALVYCKMPWCVKQHWIKKLDETFRKVLSYADVAASGPKQSPEDAAAPRPAEVITTESASTASLIDVDVPSVRTVPSDFLEQDVQTETQAGRLERDVEAAKAKAEQAKKKAGKKARDADSWLVRQFSSLSYLGYRAWGLYEKGNLTWKNAGVGVGILAGVGAVEAVFGRYLYKGKKNGSS